MPYMIRRLGYPRFSGFGQFPTPEARRVDVLTAFPFDKHMLIPQHHQQLIALSRHILSRPAGEPVQFIMVGHTDPVGTGAYNQELALRRAAEARRQLVATLERMRPGSSRAVSVTIESRGATQIIPNSPERSRRVEIFRPAAPNGGTPAPPASVAPSIDWRRVAERGVRLIEQKAATPQTQRLQCLLRKLQNEHVNDAWIPWDYNVQQIAGGLPREMTGQQITDYLAKLMRRVRKELKRPLVANAPDDQFVMNLRRIDDEILRAIRSIYGIVNQAGHGQFHRAVWEWMRAKSDDPNHIYSCYRDYRGGP